MGLGCFYGDQTAQMRFVSAETEMLAPLPRRATALASLKQLKGSNYLEGQEAGSHAEITGSQCAQLSRQPGLASWWLDRAGTAVQPLSQSSNAKSNGGNQPQSQSQESWGDTRGAPAGQLESSEGQGQGSCLQVAEQPKGLGEINCLKDFRGGKMGRMQMWESSCKEGLKGQRR